MGVDGRGLNVVVAEQELNVPDAGAASQQVGREAMAKEMYVGFQIERTRIAFDDLLDHRV